MPSNPSSNTAKSFATQLLTTSPPEAHPFVRALADGTLSLAEARRAALEIGAVVRCFPRFLAALIANLADYRERMHLVENLYHEHGAMDPDRVHEVTYRGFLRKLGIDDATIEGYRPGLAATVYNRALLDLCTRQAVPEALGALGVIEEIVARVSLVVRAYAHRINADQEAHFSLHETLDLRHSDEIYALSEPWYAASQRPDVERGMRLGHYYHMRLYTDLGATGPA